MKDGFFVGWARPPIGMIGFIAGLSMGIIGLFGGLGYLLAATMDDPGDGAFRFDWGRQTVTGVLTEAPYPVLHIIESERWPAGKALLLSASGKNGAQPQAAGLDGQVVMASGVAVARGDLTMLQLRGGTDGLAAAEGTGAPPVPQDLGRWRLTGEICDGKCYAGTMRPGRGIAHKACANLCISGGAPPLFVATDMVDGEDILLLAGPDGGAIDERVLAMTAALVEIEGQATRLGDLVVFTIDPDTIRLAP